MIFYRAFVAASRDELLLRTRSYFKAHTRRFSRELSRLQFMAAASRFESKIREVGVVSPLWRILRQSRNVRSSRSLSVLFRSCATDLSLRREIRKGSLAPSALSFDSKTLGKERHAWNSPRFGIISLVASRASIASYHLLAGTLHRTTFQIAGSLRKM
jgi:hypothetical protein